MSIKNFTTDRMNYPTACQIVEALKENEGNRTITAKKLNISIRGMRISIQVIRKYFTDLYDKIPEPCNSQPNTTKHY